MSEYKLSASLEGHEDDVRGVIFPTPGTVVSASRDATVRVWKSTAAEPTKYDGTIASHGTAFINVVTYLPPSKRYPEGLVLSGGKDALIEVREPGKAPDANAERLLIGHAHNVCTLDVSPDGRWVVSGSWDASARVWTVGSWECVSILEEHEASVWSVLAYDSETIITACADKLIRIFAPNGKLLQTLRGHTDVARALCKLPKGHSSGADFASAGNDGIIRLWQIKGREVGQLLGHEAFIYSIACLPNGDVVSSGEDRTVRVWRDSQCIQTITHPAISVWSVAVCSENGDIVSGASDRIVRVFTQSAERRAEPQTIEAFEEAVKSSAIPQQQVGEINKEKLPGPEFLTQKSGTKEGQVIMIREANGGVTAHSWSTAASQWISVGTVVDGVGSSGNRTEYLGQDYDYVFDVDIKEGAPPLKLPYNLSQNPYEAATKFIQDNELSMGYLDQVANFITTNARGATIGQTSSQEPASAGSDPWGSENRYRPGDDRTQTPYQPPLRPTVLPQTQYLSITTANINTIQTKLEELNNQLISSGQKELSLNPPQLSALRNLSSTLASAPTTIPSSSEGLDSVFHIITIWPPSLRLPGLDLFRLLAAATPSIATPTLFSALGTSGALTDADRPNNQMLAVRALANLLSTEKGRALVDSDFNALPWPALHALVQSGKAVNRNLAIALATLHINLSVLLTSPANRNLPSSTDRALSLLDDVTKMLGQEKDSEAVYRALVALGTLLSLGEDVQAAARDIYGVGNVLAKAEGGLNEPRIRGVVGEMLKYTTA